MGAMGGMHMSIEMGRVVGREECKRRMNMGVSLCVKIGVVCRVYLFEGVVVHSCIKYNVHMIVQSDLV